MGVQLGNLIKGREIEREALTGRVVSVDAYNWLYQFVTIIRDRTTGEPLTDERGRVTSHLSGIFYRTSKLIGSGIKTVWVFDGRPPEFKRVVRERAEARAEAEERLKKAVEIGDLEEIRVASQQAATVTEEMIDQAKTLLRLMGIPVIQAPSEGEAQCAHMCRTGMVYSTASQDFDSLLFGSSRLVRNLSITGRKKMPGKNEYVRVRPELIELEGALASLGVTREQLIILSMLVGTDYNPGIKGIGPKRALKIVKEAGTLEGVLRAVDWDSQFEGEPVPAETIFSFFMNPPVDDSVTISFGKPDREGILKFLVDDFGFSEERVNRVLDEICSASQTSLLSFG